MDKMKFTQELDKRLAVVVQAYLKSYGENIEKVNTESYYDKGTIHIRVIEKKRKATK